MNAGLKKHLYQFDPVFTLRYVLMIDHIFHKRQILIILCTGFMVFVSCIDAGRKIMPVAHNGVLNLTAWDFGQDGFVTLNGPWQFTWMEEVTDHTVSDTGIQGVDSIKIPAVFKRAVNTPYGYGWLRLKVILRSEDRLRLSIKNTLGAAEIYCNGDKIISTGIAGNSSRDYLPERTTKDVLLPAADTLNLAWKVVNFDDRLGGPRHAPRIYNDRDFLRTRSGSDYRRGLLFGVIFIMSLYHILLWYRRRNDYASLFFGLFCFIMLIRHFTTEMVHSSFIDTMGYFPLLYKIEFLTLPFGCSVFLLFIARLFPSDISRRTLHVILLLHGLLALFIVFTHSVIFTTALLVFELSVCLTILICCITLVKAILKRRAYSKLLLTGFIILSLSVGYEIATTHSHSDSRFIISAGMVLFILVQSTILSFKFADAYNTAEHLTKYLKEEVDAKTEDIRLKSAELEKMYNELKKADEYKTRFFQNVTHEFKTPLTLIAGPVQSALKGHYGTISDALRKQLEMVMHNGLKTINLVNQLLELARSDAKHIRLTVQKCCIKDTLARILSYFESLAEKCSIGLSFTAHDTMSLQSYIDPDKFERIFYNLLSNAFKFTGEYGNIRVNLKLLQTSEPMKYIISVKDTGKGIPEEDIPQIFNRFYKVYGREISGTQGSGIGLALVKEYASLHGASIDVISNPGAGTEFVLTFPLIETRDDVKKYFSSDKSTIEFLDGEECIHLEKEEIGFLVQQTGGLMKSITVNGNNSLRADTGKGKTIMIIEDNNDMRSYIKDILNDDYDVLEARNGEEGFLTVMNKMPDLIISDIMMPKMDGIQLCRKLKTDITTEHIPLMLLTARSDCFGNLEGYMTGADDYITKPFSRDLLLVRIKNLIESREKIKEHYRIRFLSEPEPVILESKVEKFVNKAVNAVECHISDSNYNVEQFAVDLGISPAQLYRKLMSILGQSPAEFIRIVRLKRAAKILEESIEKDINVSEVAYCLGFANHSHFSQSFKKHYGISPTDYAKQFQ
ncbi:MAG: response regulator [Bacteroidales bacterium]|nr:response regulator [Bacteroidales bacterium]